MPKKEPEDDSGKKKALVAAGAATAAAPLAPVWRKGAPYASGRRMIERDTKGTAGRARTSDVRSAAIGDGFRFGNEGYTARLAQKIRDNGFDESKPIKLSRYRDGNLVVTDGHHRLRAAEMLGMDRVPTKIENVPEKKYQRRVPLIMRDAHDKGVANARKPRGKLSPEDLDRKAKSRPGPLGDAYNKFNSAAERVGMKASKFLRQRPGLGRAAVKVGAGSAAGVVAGAGAATAVNAASNALSDKKKDKDKVDKAASSRVKTAYRRMLKDRSYRGEDLGLHERQKLIAHADGKAAGVHLASQKKRLKSAASYRAKAQELLDTPDGPYAGPMIGNRPLVSNKTRSNAAKTLARQDEDMARRAGKEAVRRMDNGMAQGDRNKEWLREQHLRREIYNNGKTRDWSGELRRMNLKHARQRKNPLHQFPTQREPVGKGLTSAMKRAHKTGDWYSLEWDDLNRYEQHRKGRDAAKRIAQAREWRAAGHKPESYNKLVESAGKDIVAGKKIKRARKTDDGFSRIPTVLRPNHGRGTRKPQGILEQDTWGRSTPVKKAAKKPKSIWPNYLLKVPKQRPPGGPPYPKKKRLFEKSMYHHDSNHPDPRRKGVLVREHTYKPISEMDYGEREKVRYTIEHHRRLRQKGEMPFGMGRKSMGPGNFRYENYAMEDVNHDNPKLKEPKVEKPMVEEPKGRNAKRGFNWRSASEAEGMPSHAGAAAMPVGGKREGRGVVFFPKGKKTLPATALKHEMRHLVAGTKSTTPNRSEGRLTQIAGDPKKLAWEEARATGVGKPIRTRKVENNYDEFFRHKKLSELMDRVRPGTGKLMWNHFAGQMKSKMGLDVDEYVKARKHLSKLPVPKNDPDNHPLPRFRSGRGPKIVGEARAQMQAVPMYAKVLGQAGLGKIKARFGKSDQVMKMYVSKRETKKERRVREGLEANDRNQKKRFAQGAAGAGVAAGLVAGGIPGAKPNPEEFKHVIRGKTLKERGKALYRSGKGGIFGYREQAHKKATKQFQADTDWYKGTGPAARVSDHYHRGRVEGKIRPEKKVIPHMRKAKILSNAGLLASLGLGAHATLSKRSRDEDERGRRAGGGAAVAAGVGATGGLGMLAGGHKLASEARVYRQAEKRDLARAHGLNPKLKPELRERKLEDPRQSREVFRGYNRQQAEEQGKHRGRASQHRYFDRSYKMNAKWVKRAAYPLLAVGAAGGINMLAAHKNEEARLKESKKPVKKKAPKVLKPKNPPNTSGLKAPGTKIDRKGPHSRPFGV